MLSSNFKKRTKVLRQVTVTTLEISLANALVVLT